MRPIVVLLMLGLVSSSAVQGEIRTEFALDSDPKLIPPDPIIHYPEKHRPLWLVALGRPEADLQRRAADAIAEAHLLGTPKLSEAQPILVKLVSSDTTHRPARLAAAKALIALDARDSAAVLFEASQKHGLDLRQVVEPVLAKWKHQPIREVWRQRLIKKETRHRDLILAIDGLGEVRDDSSVPALLAIIHDASAPAATRLAAARAAGRSRHSGLEPDAHRLAPGDESAPAPVSNRLCSVALLDQHRSESAHDVLLRLAKDAEPSVAAAALKSLNISNQELVLTLAEQAMKSHDANVRQQGVTAYIERPTPERLAIVARLLDDPHSGVRVRVREALFSLAQKEEFAASIHASTAEVLAAESWRGQEQAALLLAALEHKPIAAQLVQLLESPREEVTVAAAWGLRKLAVASTLPGILDKVSRQTEQRLKNGLSAAGDAQVAHLCEVLGLLKYAPAEPLLRSYIPKNYSLGEQSRSSAIWALGHLHDGTPDEPLAQLLMARMTDPGTMPPEMPRVRLACTISLGRMQAKSQLTELRKFLGVPIGPDQMSLALRWAIQKLSGETLPEPTRPAISHQAGWFLEPLE